MFPPCSKLPLSLGVKAQILKTASKLSASHLYFSALQPPTLPLLTGSGSTSFSMPLEHTRHPLAQASSTCFSFFSQKPEWVMPSFPSDPLLKCHFFTAAFLTTLYKITSPHSHYHVPRALCPLNCSPSSSSSDIFVNVGNIQTCRGFLRVCLTQTDDIGQGARSQMPRRITVLQLILYTRIKGEEVRRAPEIHW